MYCTNPTSSTDNTFSPLAFYVEQWGEIVTEKRRGLAKDRVQLSDSLNDKDTMTVCLRLYGWHTHRNAHTHTSTQVHHLPFFSLCSDNHGNLSVRVSVCLLASLSRVSALLTRRLRGFTAIQPLNYNTVKMGNVVGTEDVSTLITTQHSRWAIYLQYITQIFHRFFIIYLLNHHI